MLFYLKRKHGDVCYYLADKLEYSIGRKNTDIILSGDDSISRKHVVIKTENGNAALEDCGSKYGTYINEKVVSKNVKVKLKEGMEIRFGMLDSTFRLETLTIVVTLSGATSQDKEAVRKKIETLKGMVVSAFTPNCTHVVTRELLLTVKVLCAIIMGTPIVSFAFWDACIENMRKNVSLPDPNDYAPPLNDAISSKKDQLAYKPERKTLFTDKIFVFATESLKKKMEDAIVAANGSCISWEKTLPQADSIRDSSSYIFIQDEAAKSVLYQNTLKRLAEMGKRPIPMQEIAMAIVSCSCEKDCNPSFDRAGVLVEGTLQLNNGNVLVAGTQLSQFFEISTNISVPPTPPFVNASPAAFLEQNKSPPPSFSTFKEPVCPPVSKSVAAKRHEIEAVDESSPPKRKKTVEENKRTEEINLSFKRRARETPNPEAKRCRLDDVSDRLASSSLSEAIPDTNDEEVAVSPSQRTHEVWLNKSTNFRKGFESVLKNEPVEYKYGSTDWEREMQKSVREVYAPLIVRRSDRTTSDVNVSYQDKNFKKFKKVLPKHIQTTIIGRWEHVLPVNTEQNQGIVELESDDEEMEVDNRAQQVQTFRLGRSSAQASGKQFQFCAF